MKKFMDAKTFTFTLINVAENFDNLDGGSYKDSDIDMFTKFMSSKNDEINISASFTKFPSMSPLWLILYVQIQDQEDKYFIDFENTSTRFKKSFTSTFNKAQFTNNTIITYKLVQVPSYICSLQNESCTCYLNCGIQLLFHLSKFRSFLLNKITSEEKTGWLKELIDLFQLMCNCKKTVSTEKLTESFGWPKLARTLLHDSSEFMQKILEKIDEKLENKKRKKIEKIFISKILCNEKVENRYMINLINPEDDGTLYDAIKMQMVDSSFVKFPEVLFLQTKDFDVAKVTPFLDMSGFSSSENRKNSQYVLSGVIVNTLIKENVYHFTSFVRVSTEDVWLYFNDSFHILYGFRYNKKLKQNESCLDSHIKSLGSKSKIHLLMYISKDVLGEYFAFTSCCSNYRERKDDYEGTDRLIEITKIEDIKKYVESGRTDFQEIESSIKFEIGADKTFSDVYQKVSEIVKRPISTFNLRSESQTKAPSFQIIRNDSKSQLKMIRIPRIRIYYKEIDSQQNTVGFLVPFYFLLFKFKPKDYLTKISDNLVHRKFEIPQSTITTMHPKMRLGIKNSICKSDKDKKDQNAKQNIEKNSFEYLANIPLKTNDTFKSILNRLLEIINENDQSKKHTKINLYFAKYNSKGDEKICYQRIDVNLPVCKYFQQAICGTYVYVQCEDNYLESCKNSQLEKKVERKFLFYKHFMSLDEKLTIYPRELPNVFVMEKFAIPVTFCNINDPENRSKTMLFPVIQYFKDIELLKRFVCNFMDEKYPEENVGLMQFFIGFKSLKWPPFHDPYTRNFQMKYIYNILIKSLENGGVTKKWLYGYDDSSQEINNEENEVNNDDEYVPNVYVHYNIFDTFDPDKEISFRVYFSEDSIMVKLVAQVKLPKDSTVKDLTLKLRSIFGSKFSKEDDQILRDYEDNKLVFTNEYRILQSSNGRISREINLNTKINSNYEIFFVKINKSLPMDDIYCYIPVYYGANYSPNKNNDDDEFDDKINTKYIGAFGTPFYFPVLKSDIDDPIVQNCQSFKRSNMYQRLRSMISVKSNDFNLCVVNFSGIVQNVSIHELKTIIEKKLNYSVCIKNLNSSLFIDEIGLFSGDLRILT